MSRARKALPFLVPGLVLGVVAAYWFATGGIPSGEDRARWVSGATIAHRGLHTGDSVRPENSLAAFRAAMREDFPIELDVHLAAGGEVVVFHDDALERMTGDPRAISETRVRDLDELRLLDSPERVPTLREVLDLVDGDVPILIEIKNRGEVGPLEVAVVRELAGYPGDFAIQSFNPYSLAAVRDANPRIPRGQLASGFEGENLAFHEVFVLRSLLMNWKSRPDFIAYDLKALPTLGTRLQQFRGRPLIGWTAYDPHDIEHAETHCDGVIFDPGALE
jgi:glycerophosphoryl diester phosphodiesterase